VAKDATLRKARYDQLQALGYSSADASRLRDRSADSIDADIAARQKRISKKPAAKRTASESFQIERIREYRRERREQPTVSREPIESRESRLAQFSDWSVRRDFPPRIIRYIAEINHAAGNDELDSYGFRVFYHQYVNGYTERKAKMHVRTLERERRDT
jgi:hypothetical protein